MGSLIQLVLSSCQFGNICIAIRDFDIIFLDHLPQHFDSLKYAIRQMFDLKIHVVRPTICLHAPFYLITNFMAPRIALPPWITSCLSLQFRLDLRAEWKWKNYAVAGLPLSVLC